MVVLRSFAFIFIAYALVAMEATVSNDHKVGGRQEGNDEIETKNEKSKGQCPKTEGTLKRHR